MTDQLPSKDLNVDEIRGALRAARQLIETLARDCDRLFEDLQRTESARIALLAENEHYKRRVEELSIHAEKWVQRALKPAHEREAPHCSTCACPPFSPWQPIETAPVQMDAILLTDWKWFAAGHVDPCSTRRYPIYHFAVSQEYDWEPTHWMPIPAGPSQPPGAGQ